MSDTKDRRDVHFVTLSGHLVDQNGQEYGTKGAGKTYVGKFIQDQIGLWSYHPVEWTHDGDVRSDKPHRWPCVMRNLADPLKEACQVIWPSSDAKAEGDKKNAAVDLGCGAQVSHRALWQTFGTEGVRRGVGGALEAMGALPAGESVTLWARSVVAYGHHTWLTMSSRDDVALVVIVADVRFPDELRTLMRSGGAAHICVRRRVDRDLSQPIDTHPSETSLPLALAQSIAGDKCFVYDNVTGVRADRAPGGSGSDALMSHLEDRIMLAYGLDPLDGVALL